jgi:hypothetical protein
MSSAPPFQVDEMESLNLDKTISLNDHYKISLQGFLKQPLVLVLGFVSKFMYINPEMIE